MELDHLTPTLPADENPPPEDDITPTLAENPPPPTMEDHDQIQTIPENPPPTTMEDHDQIQTLPENPPPATMEDVKIQTPPENPPPATMEDVKIQTLPENPPPATMEDVQIQTLPENPPPATMEDHDQPQTLIENPPPADIHHRHNIDTSRPFRSVKEAVAVFGERFLTGEIYSPSPKPKQETPKWKLTPSASNNQLSLWKSPENEKDPPPIVMNTLKKLESELEETKRELNMLKERESETEVALASLNAELHKNMSKIAKAEADVAGKAAAVRSSTTLRQVLSGGDGGGEKGWERKYVNKERKTMKKKPVIPLVTDLFTRNKEKSKNYSLMNPHYTSYWN